MVKSKQDPTTKIVKITDFGMSKEMYKPKAGWLKPGDYGGTQVYMAPEIFRDRLYSEFKDVLGKDIGFDAFKADIYALGVVLYEMLCVCTPFDKFTRSQLMYQAQMARNWTFPTNTTLTTDVKLLVEAMIEPDPAHRLDPYGIWMHPWIQKSYVRNQGWKSIQKKGDGSTPPGNEKQKSRLMDSIIKVFKR